MRCLLAIGVCACLATGWAEILRIGDLNTAQLKALDRSKTVVMVTGGMLEEHGPYLPSATDAILSDRLTQDVARSINSKKSGWTVLLFPQIPLGASGSNEIGGRYSFPGTFVVRPSTLRTMFMDLAANLGDQGFRQIVVIHVHGSPNHLRAIDDAGDFFRDSYGGWMINLWDLVPVISGWGNAMAAAMTNAEKKEDGASLHGGADEHSLILYLKPELVVRGYRNAPAITGASAKDGFDVAKRGGWPGYIGSPRLASAALGEKIWKAFAAAASDQALKIIDGADPSRITRYVDLLEKNPLYREQWIQPAQSHDDALGQKERDWLSKKVR